MNKYQTITGFKGFKESETFMKQSEKDSSTALHLATG